jgi:hypothetical protein
MRNALIVGVLYGCKGHGPSLLVRERERERGREGERVRRRGREYFLGMMAALAPFSYLVTQYFLLKVN